MTGSKSALKRGNFKRTEKLSGMIMSAPAAILLTGFLIIPILYTIYYSFFAYQVIRPDNVVFNGLDNYIDLFQDEDFWLALKNTVYFTVLVVPIQCVLALALAMLVTAKRKGVSVFRTMYFSPQVTSMVVIAILWTILYNSNANTGLINAFLTSFGMEPIDFLNNPGTAMNAIIFMSAWQGAGYQMMIFLAGLNGIPQEQYEAASVDGAGKWAQFRYVTLPGLTNTIKYVLMITIIQAMKLFTQPYIMTKGGPQNSTKTLVYYIYEQGFQRGSFGYACAVATVFFILVVGISLVVKKLTRTN
nr:sugar ABC transporter permease [uncultured Mediterraneibacter sp.]